MTLSILFRNLKFQTDTKSGNSKCYWTSPSYVYLQGNFLTQERKSSSRPLFSKAQNDFPCYQCHLCDDSNLKIYIWVFLLVFFRSVLRRDKYFFNTLDKLIFLYCCTYWAVLLNFCTACHNTLKQQRIIKILSITI